MQPTSEQINAILEYVATDGQLLLIIADDNGIIEATNRFTQNLYEDRLVGSSFKDIVIDFSNSFSFKKCLHDSDHKQMLSLTIPNQHPRSYLFSFLAVENKVIIIGETDVFELEQLKERLLHTNSELNDMTRELHKKNSELQRALNEIKTLQGIIPICMHCKEIRDDKGYWNRLEAYIEAHSEAQFSHSICEKCLKEFYPEYDEE